MGAALPLGQRGRLQAHEGLERKIGEKERQEEKMVANGREWLIDLGQGPVRTEEIAGKMG